ncbi:MAG TPA: class II aldolase/adducin family protein [Ramlibacter sp.]|jgi:ribulose-5-phosphate 4-epimerase/fuculose-1-phosphate aldolase|nr:class II aldolase/adducin family protein [Ramlibacter sp.]
MTEPAQQKQQLVDCIRMLEQSNIIDYNGHASVRAGEGRMFINTGSCQRGRLTVADICTIDMEGNVIEGEGKPPLEFHLHAGIYKSRPDVQAVVHAHPKWSTFLTMVGEPYRPVYAQGSLVYPMPVLDSPNSINNPVMAARLADTLGLGPAAMMKSHGAVTVGKDLVEAFVLANYMEENAYRQYMALQIGKPYSFSQQEIEMCREKLWNTSLFKRTWDHFRSKLA